MTLDEGIDLMDRETLIFILKRILNESKIFRHQIIDMLREELKT